MEEPSTAKPQHRRGERLPPHLGIASMLEPGMRVLDAGCGSGEFTLRVAPRVRHVTGFGYAEGMIGAQRSVAHPIGMRCQPSSR